MNFFLCIILFFQAGLILLLPLNALSKEQINIYVSILPQKYFVERIAGKMATVNVLLKPGKSPATYSPSPDQIKKLASSDIYFRIGVPFENGFMNKIESIADSILIIDTRKGVPLRNMNAADYKDPDKGHHDKHDADHHDKKENHKKGKSYNYAGKDPHIWMSPVMVKIQAQTIFEALLNIDPQSRDYYKKNYDLFIKDLNQLNDSLASALKNLKGENLFVFHPSFGYLTDAYGLRQVAVEIMGRAPKGKQLSAIIKLAKKEKTRILFVQPQFDQYAARKIASAIKGTVVSIDPLAYDYLSNMKIIADTISKELKQ